MHYDLIIVGGGILGASTAYFLAQQNNKRILLIEQNSLFSGTTSQAAALINRPRKNHSLTAMVNELFIQISRLTTDFDGDIGYRQVGSLQVSLNSHSYRVNLKNTELLQQTGVEVDELHLSTKRKIAPWLSRLEGMRALFVPEDGYIDAYQLSAAYMHCARGKGVDVIQSQQVCQLLTGANTQVRGVLCTDGSRYEAEQVIITGGPWTSLLLKQVGINLPMAPVRSQYWITKDHQLFNPCDPVVMLPDYQAYTRPELGALLFGLRDQQNVHTDPRHLPKDINSLAFSVDSNGWQSLEQGLPRLAEIIPVLKDIDLVHYCSGVSSYTADGEYIIGPIEQINGLYVGTGCCGAGVAMSAGFGRLLSELANELSPFTDISRFKPERLERADPFNEHFRHQCAQARSAKRD